MVLIRNEAFLQTAAPERGANFLHRVFEIIQQEYAGRIPARLGNNAPGVQG